MEGLAGWLIVVLLVVAVVLFFRKIFGMHKRGLAHSAEAIEGMNKRLAMDAEILALNKQRVAQGDETIALLKSINENLAPRTTKN